MDENNTQNQQPGWSFKPEGQETNSGFTATSESAQTSQGQPSQDKSTNQISWTASEFADNHKSIGWYMILLVVIFSISGLTYLFTRDWISSVTIAVMGCLFAVLASKKPRQLSYSIDESGIYIGDKFHPYHSFKSFAVIDDGAIGCINLMPLKRFMPELSIYYPPEEEQKIIDVLSSSLPNEQREEQGFDKLMKKIRF